jgi:hypothetical protein
MKNKQSLFYLSKQLFPESLEGGEMPLFIIDGAKQLFLFD